MRRMMRAAVLFGVGLFAGAALAQGGGDVWCIYAGPEYKDFLFVDLGKSVVSRNGTRIAEVLEVAEDDYAAKVGFSQRAVALAYDCAKNSVAVLEVKTADANGAVLADQPVAHPAWSVVQPQTSGATDLAFLCASPSAWPSNDGYARLKPGDTPAGFALRTYHIHSFLAHPAP